MFIIYGWGSRQRTIRQGHFQCPHCQSEQTFQQYETRRYFNLFFIPIFPISSAQAFTVCGRCQSHFQQPSVLAQSRNVVTLPSVSYKAIVALVLSFFSFLSICFFIASLPISALAIILAHLSLFEIRSSKSTVQGKVPAYIALGVSYPSLILSFGIFLYFVSAHYEKTNPPVAAQGLKAPQNPNSSPEAKLNSAEDLVMSQKSGEIGFGNHFNAKELARAFAISMKEAREEFFTKQEKKPLIQFSGGEFLTYCELRGDRCLIITHVPSYRHFASDAKDSLAMIAWHIGHELAAQYLQPGDQLAVGLRGSILYGDIMVGELVDDDPALGFKRKAKREDLYAFFEGPLTIENPIAPETTSPPAEPAQKFVTPPNKSFPQLPDLAFENVPNPAKPPAATSTDSIASNVTQPLTDNANTPEQGGPMPSTSSMAAVDPNVSNPLAQNPPDSDPMKEPSLLGNSESAKNIDTMFAKNQNQPQPNPGTKTQDLYRNGFPGAPHLQNVIGIKSIAEIETKGSVHRSLCFSNDSTWLTVASADKTIETFDADTGALISRRGPADKKGVDGVVVSGDSKAIIIAEANGGLRVSKFSRKADISSSQDLTPHGAPISVLMASTKHPFIITGGQDGSIVWQTYAGTPTRRNIKDFDASVKAISLLTNKGEAMATDGRQIIQFTLKDGNVTMLFDTELLNIQQAAFNKEGTLLAQANFLSVNLWDIKQNSKVGSSFTSNYGTFKRITFHPNGKWLAVCEGPSVRFIDVDILQTATVLHFDTKASIEHVAFNDDGTRMACTSDESNHPIYLFEVPPFVE